MVTAVSTNTGSPTPEARDPDSHAPKHMGSGDSQSSGNSLGHQRCSALAPSVGDRYLPESAKLHPSQVSLPPTALATPWPLCGAESVCPQLYCEARGQALCQSHPCPPPFKILHLTLTFGGGRRRRLLPRKVIRHPIPFLSEEEDRTFFPHWVSGLRYVKRLRDKQVPVPSSLEQNPKLPNSSKAGVSHGPDTKSPAAITTSHIGGCCSFGCICSQ